ncbi:MAG: DegT/DnrJ/EryC1/StrS family aminotransferase [Desulfovibrionaceae bacterium]|nr:DegT/DnrJ/EryC1/StrS family aminotransferase [Desulfovibrionaceae bacterium]
MRLKREIHVTRPWLPPKEDFLRYVDEIYASRRLTNRGPLHDKLERRLGERLETEKLLLTANATLGLLLALHALDIKEGEVITTPFSYAATVNAILWGRCLPVFADIRADNLNLDPDRVEQAITRRTKAILPVHIYGIPCAMESIQYLADKHGLKVIYDAAQAFGVKLGGKSLLVHGDVSVCSLHATKLFNTAEGGLLLVRNPQIHQRLELLRRFGHNYDDYQEPGINAKLSEPLAALGLAGLDHLEEIIASRRELTACYDQRLAGLLRRPSMPADLEYNYAYYPVLFKDEEQLLRVFQALAGIGVYPRRYFFPSLNTLPYLNGAAPCPVSERSARVAACLPLFPGLLEEEIEEICRVIKERL